MTSPTLIATTRTAEQDATLAIPVLAEERAWLAFGEALVVEHGAMEAGQAREDATADQRDNAGFAAKGLALAINAWNETTADCRGTSRVWDQFSRLVQSEIDGGWTRPVRDGLALALTVMRTSRVEALNVAA